MFDTILRAIVYVVGLAQAFTIIIGIPIGALYFFSLLIYKAIFGL